MTLTGYETILGPAVRIGILQHQSSIRLALRGEYRVSAPGMTLPIGHDGAELSLSLKESNAAQLQWRLVILKSCDRSEAESVASPGSSLEPLATVTLGYDIKGVSTQASSVEYWRCSRPFSSQEEAEAERAKLPRPERISVLTEVVRPASGIVGVHGRETDQQCPEWIRFEPLDPEGSRVVVHDVIVGVGFHWEHLERQKFRGAVEIRVDNRGQLTAINEIPAEAYLFSVNSSEMMSVMPDELLKAQTVAARNTLFATMGKHHYADAFHLCADDHCQCYRGSSRETPDSRRVTLATAGEVLTHKGVICDARYSKMCGGIMESFDSVWNEDPRPYLPAGVDAPPDSSAQGFLPANTEERARALIESRPDCWCNTTGADVPPYLTYSAPYFRWQFRYTREEIEKLLQRSLGPDMGQLKALEPVSRGASGRIEYLKVLTSKGEHVIGKEYNIRKSLSPTFLYSSCFVVEHEYAESGALEVVTLTGGGWGHGAGLCQVGATMMAYRKKGYGEILAHYYPRTDVTRLAPEVGAQDLQHIVEQQESRDGERCYEFYNCYAVARCPVYHRKIELLAKVKGGQGHVAFSQPAGAAEDLEKLGIECEFLSFKGSQAKPKS